MLKLSLGWPPAQLGKWKKLLMSSMALWYHPKVLQTLTKLVNITGLKPEPDTLKKQQQTNQKTTKKLCPFCCYLLSSPPQKTVNFAAIIFLKKALFILLLIAF